MADPDRDEIDVAIDRAVRRMVARDPRPDFTRRVLDRLMVRQTPNRAYGPWLIPLGAAAALIVAVMLWPARERVAPPPVTSGQIAARPDTPVPSNARPSSPVVTDARELSRTTRPTLTRAAARTADHVDAASHLAHQIEPLAGPAPLGVSPLVPPDVSVAPLVVAELQVKQLSEVPELKINSLMSPR